jgi:SapC
LPILFVPDAKQQPSPVALLGLRRDENLFVEADGRWSGNYIPAFVRRYPFVLIESGTPNELTVGIDAAYPGFNTEVGEPMFTEDGTEGPGLKRAIEFLNAYRIEATRTADFVAQLPRLDLLIPRGINIALKDGSKFALEGFFVVDEARLGKLDEKEAGNLVRSGHMGWIYMHLLSIHNIADLSSRLDPRIEVKKTA